MVPTAWTSRENSLELIELSSPELVSFRFPPVVTLNDPHWTSRENNLFRNDRVIQLKSA